MHFMFPSSFSGAVIDFACLYLQQANKVCGNPIFFAFYSSGSSFISVTISHWIV